MNVKNGSPVPLNNKIFRMKQERNGTYSHDKKIDHTIEDEFRYRWMGAAVFITLHVLYIKSIF